MLILVLVLVLLSLVLVLVLVLAHSLVLANITTAVADLGFGKGGCPIHQKGSPEGPPTGVWGSPPENLKI